MKFNELPVGGAFQIDPFLCEPFLCDPFQRVPSRLGPFHRSLRIYHKINATDAFNTVTCKVEKIPATDSVTALKADDNLVHFKTIDVGSWCRYFGVNYLKINKKEGLSNHVRDLSKAYVRREHCLTYRNT